MGQHSLLQLWTIKNFGKREYFAMPDNDDNTAVVNVGPMGVGKTYVIMEAFGIYLMSLKEQGYDKLNFVLIGKTLNAIKKNMTNVLSKLFGTDFKFDHSTINGVVCDARLFNFPLFFVPLNDSQAEARIRGLSDITGAILDEHTLISEEQYTLILSRIRGGVELPEPYVNNWLISSTNPDSPSHWLLKNYIEKGLIKEIHWRCSDASWNGFKKYMDRIKKQYRHIKAFYERYVLGRWRAAEGLVYCCFDQAKNVVKGQIDYSQIKRTWISADYGSNHKTSIQVHHMTYQSIRIISQVYEYERTAVSTIAHKIVELIDTETEQLIPYRQTFYGHEDIIINVYVDPAAQALQDELRKLGISPINAKNSHKDGIAFVNSQFNDCLLYILRNEGTQLLIDEIYNYKYNPSEKAKDGDVIKMNDDHCDALRYGIYTDHCYNDSE